MGEGAVLLLAFLFSKSEIILLNNLSGILVFIFLQGLQQFLSLICLFPMHLKDWQFQ